MPFLALLSLALLLQPVNNPAFLTNNSPWCVARAAYQGNVLPLLVYSPEPSCPWSVEDVNQVTLSEWATRYSYWNTARSTNLELAAKAIDGTLLLPGQEFSFNQTVGERTEESGFQRAKVIATNTYKEDIGGGICQTSSTLHAAFLMAGMEIVERNAHKFRVGYIPPGLDATVDYGNKDLRIRNSLPFPVVIEMGRSSNSLLVARIKAPAVRYRVRYKYELLEEVPSDRVEFVVDADKDRVKYYGRPGIKIERFLHRKDLITGRRHLVKMGKDDYSPSPWTLRVAQVPEGRSYRRGVSQKEIASLLKGSGYKAREARFKDVDKEAGDYVSPRKLNRKEQKTYERFNPREENGEDKRLSSASPR